MLKYLNFVTFIYFAAGNIYIYKNNTNTNLENSRRLIKEVSPGGYNIIN